MPISLNVTAAAESDVANRPTLTWLENRVALFEQRLDGSTGTAKWFVGIVALVLIPWLGWLSIVSHSQGERLARIEGASNTRKQGRRLSRTTPNWRARVSRISRLLQNTVIDQSPGRLWIRLIALPRNHTLFS